MANGSKQDWPEAFEGPFNNLLLLTLPWLCLQQELLGIAKKVIDDAVDRKPTERFSFIELHALLMVFDRSRHFRDRLGDDFDERLQKNYDELYDKFSSASIGFIEAQESALEHIIEELKKLKNRPKPKKQSQSQD